MCLNSIPTVKDLNYLGVNTSRDFPGRVQRRWRSGSPLWTGFSRAHQPVCYRERSRCSGRGAAAEQLCASLSPETEPLKVLVRMGPIPRRAKAGVIKRAAVAAVCTRLLGEVVTRVEVFFWEKKESVVVRALALGGHGQAEGAHTTRPISHPRGASKLRQCPASLLLN